MGSLADQAEFVPREMCFDCARPVATCHCHTIPRVLNRTELLLVQHIRERSHPFNTARMVKSAFSNVVSVVDYAEAMPKYDSRLHPRAALLYPSKSSQLLNELDSESPPEQIVVLDGTWHQAKRLFRNWPALNHIPHFRLALGEPGQYRIRLEPDEHSLSTVEAIVAAYKVLEPDLAGLDQLLNSFNTMVSTQLSHSSASYKTSLVPRKPNINIPRSLSQDYNRLIVAYGEAAPGRDGRWNKHSVRPPVYWVAKRLATSQKFSTTVKPPFEIADRYLQHFELDRRLFDNASTTGCFKEQWSRFTRPGDILVVQNASTLRLLDAVGIAYNDFIELKSVNFDPDNNYGSLGEMFDAHGILRTSIEFPGRAGLRIRNAETLVRYLITQLQSDRV